MSSSQRIEENHPSNIQVSQQTCEKNLLITRMTLTCFTPNVHMLATIITIDLRQAHIHEQHLEAF